MPWDEILLEGGSHDSVRTRWTKSDPSTTHIKDFREAGRTFVYSEKSGFRGDKNVL